MDSSHLLQIIQVEDIPYTINGKRVEVPVKKVSLVAVRTIDRKAGPPATSLLC